MKLHHIGEGEKVTNYHNRVIRLAEKLGYKNFYQYPVGDHYYFTVEMFNEVVDWLLSNRRDEWTH